MVWFMQCCSCTCAHLPPPDVPAVAGLTLLSWVNTNTRALFMFAFTGNKYRLENYLNLQVCLNLVSKWDAHGARIECLRIQVFH